MLNTTRKKAGWYVFAVLTVLLLVGSPIVTPAVFAGDCPNPTGSSC